MVHVLLLSSSSSEKLSLGAFLAKAFALVALPLGRMSRVCPWCRLFGILDTDTFTLLKMATEQGPGTDVHGHGCTSSSAVASNDLLPPGKSLTPEAQLSLQGGRQCGLNGIDLSLRVPRAGGALAPLGPGNHHIRLAPPSAELSVKL